MKIFILFLFISTPLLFEASTSNLKADALLVLEKKCNFCHRKKNPRKVFTTTNMNRLAPKIQKQVFVKKRMPKGKNNQLNAEELNVLTLWLNALK